jgi:hypothetical protein
MSKIGIVLVLGNMWLIDGLSYDSIYMRIFDWEVYVLL